MARSLGAEVSEWVSFQILYIAVASTELVSLSRPCSFLLSMENFCMSKRMKPWYFQTIVMKFDVKMNATVFAKTTQLCLKPAKQNHIMILQKCSICFLGRESCRKTIKTQSSVFGVCQTK